MKTQRAMHFSAYNTEKILFAIIEVAFAHSLHIIKVVFANRNETLASINTVISVYTRVKFLKVVC